MLIKDKIVKFLGGLGSRLVVFRVSSMEDAGHRSGWVQLTAVGTIISL